jgi:hypothetical protein
MAWFDKPLWTRRRVEPGRESLAASLEEMAARGELSHDEWEAEAEDGMPEADAVIIPPRLRLQSRPLPVVRVDTTRGLRAAREQRPQAKGMLVETPEALSAQTKRLGRSTRVRLQAVRVDRGPEPTTERVPAAVPGVDEQGSAQQSELYAPFHPFNGSGVIERGQEEMVVACTQVCSRSVVTVMLAGNPGPVVVQYVTLHPRVGFTFHLSAPVVAPTPFNYLFWPCAKEA